MNATVDAQNGGIPANTPVQPKAPEQNKELVNPVPKRDFKNSKFYKDFQKGSVKSSAGESSENNSVPVETGKSTTEVPATEIVETFAEETKTNSILDSFSRALETKEESTKESTHTVPDKEENLASLRKSRDELKNRFEDLEKRYKETESKIPTDYETLKSEREKYKTDYDLVIGELKKYSLAATPEFKEKYETPIKQAIAVIEKSLLTADSPTEISSSQFMDAVKLPESKERTRRLSELVDGMDKLSQQKIASAISYYDITREARDRELANPDPAIKMNFEKQELQKKQQMEYNRQIIAETIQKAEIELPWLKEGQDESWNSVAKEIKDQARIIWLEPPANPHQNAEVALRAAAFPKVYTLLMEAYKELGKRDTDLKKLRGSTPSIEPKKPAVIPDAKKGRGSFLNAYKGAMTPT